MAIALQGQAVAGDANAVTAGPLTIPYTVISAADILVVMMSTFRNGGPVQVFAAPTGMGATWTLLGQFNAGTGNGDGCTIWVGVNPTVGAGTFSVGVTNTTFWEASITEWSGCTATLDGTFVSGTQQNSPSITTTNPDDVLLAMVQSNNDFITITGNTGWTNLTGKKDAGSNNAIAACYQIVSSTGTRSVTSTTNGNAADKWALVALQATTGGALDATPATSARARAPRFAFLSALTRGRSRAYAVVPPQLNPPIATPILVSPRHRGAVARRGRTYPVVPTQAAATAPVIVAAIVDPARRLHGLAQRRSRFFAPIVPVDVPVALVSSSRRPRGVLAPRRRLQVHVTTQAPVLPRVVLRRRALPFMVLRRRPPPHMATQAPVLPRMVARRPRALRARVVRHLEIVPTQAVAPPNPAIAWTITRARARGVPIRRRARADVVPAQATPPTNPAIAWTVTRVRPRGLRVRRGRLVDVVPAPVVIVTPALVQSIVRSPLRIRGLVVPRRRAATHVPAQAPVPHTLIVRRPKGLRARRGRIFAPVPAQVVFINPPYPMATVRQGRRWRWIFTRRRARIEITPAQVLVLEWLDSPGSDAPGMSGAGGAVGLEGGGAFPGGDRGGGATGPESSGSVTSA